jgi:Rieske Fe-S protein
MDTTSPGRATRRTVIAGATLGVGAAAAGCTSYGQPTGAPPPAQPPAATPPADGSAPAAGPPLAQVADVPVGGGTILAAAKVVLTQPESGTIRAFSVACTHQGCAVSEVKDGTINCACHGSKFRVADGAVTAGPATAPLPPVNVTVEDGAIRLA